MSFRRMDAGPDTCLPAFHGQFLVAQKSVADYEAALFPLSHVGFCYQFITVRRRDDKPRVRLHHRNADYTMGQEKFLQRKACRAEQGGRAVIEPAKIVGVENDLGRITVSELDPDSHTIRKHE